MYLVFEKLAELVVQRGGDLAFGDDAGSVTWAELAARVTGLVRALDGAAPTVAIGLAGGIDYVVADLAITLSGRRQVPLPFFFSNEQNAHILMETGVGAVVANDPSLFAALPVPVISPRQDPVDGPLPAYQGGADRVIYTSGSSGKPKGVIIGDRQLTASLNALSGVIAADQRDRHLSVLPLAQLLEQICGIFLPILAGAPSYMRFEATKSLFGAQIEALLNAVQEVQPTTSVIAPGLLGRWVAALNAAGQSAPACLRFVAVGGAPSSAALIHAAEAVGLPVYEGYGLSECCAVVAMNRPGQNAPGTVGPVLDGLDVQIIDGEITVAGPTVMGGYLRGDAVPDRWHTGDVGHFNDGNLVVDGRKDNLLVTPAGRNVSPEWVEARVNADPRVVASALGLRDADGALVLIAALAAPVEAADLAALMADLPDYARPAAIILTRADEPGLLFPAGTPNRAVVTQIIQSRAAIELRATQVEEA